MCGIVGILQYESGVSREVRHRALKILFSSAMQKTEVRGEDATGIYQVHTDGDWAMTKKGIKASEWLFLDGKDSDDPVVYSDFMDAWLEHDQELTALVGHCRKATVGSKGRDNDDNHPFAVQLDDRNAILGIHNGTLYNHETIFRNLPKFLKRQGQVDSESIFHLMFHLSEHGTKPFDEEMMEKLGGRLDGAAACIVVNTRFPSQVVTFRFGRPMEYFFISPLNIVIICSEKKFVEAALERYEFYRKLFDNELPALATYNSALAEKDFRIFDTSIPWPAGKPGWKDLNEISVRGNIKPYNVPLEAGWFTPITPTTKPATRTGTNCGSSQGAYSGTQSGATSQVKTTKAGNKTAVKAIPAAAGKKADDDGSMVVVEVEIGSEEEAERATERAKSMGICTHFDSDAEISKTIGLTQMEMDKLTKVELANLLAKTHFNFGYAVSRFDTKSEIRETRKKGRDITKRLERAEEKKLRSQNRIWELRQLVTLMLSLDDSGYPLTEGNIGISLSAFSTLSESRRKDISDQAKSIFRDSSVQKVIRDLRKQYQAAKQRDQGRAKRATTIKE